MSAYRAAKQKISDNQTSADWIILNSLDAAVKDFEASTTAKKVYFSDRGTPEDASFLGVFREGSALFSQWNGTRQRICDIADIPLQGAHNVQNTLAAIAVGLIFGVSETQIREALQHFDRSHPALSHAFEPVKTLTGVEFIDDSKATNVAAVKAALESIKDSQIVLIMGGYDKGNDYTPLREIVSDSGQSRCDAREYTQRLIKRLPKQQITKQTQTTHKKKQQNKQKHNKTKHKSENDGTSGTGCLHTRVTRRCRLIVTRKCKF